MLDVSTEDNIRAARTKDGLTSDQHQIPYRNIRDVLSLHAKVSGSKPFLIDYDADNNRTELTYGEFVARAHQVANVLYEDLSLRRGDRVATLMHNHADTLLIYFACWIIGAAVVPQNAGDDDERIASILGQSGAKVCFVMSDYIDRARHIVSETPNIIGIIQVGGKMRDDIVHFQDIVKNRPTTFLGDDSGAKSADMPIIGGNERTATLDDEALIIYAEGTPKGIVLTQYNLLIAAKGVSEWQTITGNQRLMGVLPVHDVDGVVGSIMTPLYVGGSVVLNRAFDAAHFWERIVRNRVNVVFVSASQVQALLDYAGAQESDGNTIFGHNIGRRNLTRFRHLICGSGLLSTQLAHDFETKFGYPVMYGYGVPEAAGFSCFLPVNLAWETHQAWLFEQEHASVGLPIGPNEVAIFAVDGSGEQLSTGEHGEICIRGHNVMKHYDQQPDANAETFKFGWLRTGDTGFYKEDEQSRRFFFVTGRLE